MSQRNSAVYNHLTQKLGIKAAQISFGQLRVAVLAVSAQGQYGFNIRKDVGTSLVHDVKLDVNDSFVATHLGIKIMAEDPAKPGTGVLQTFPNQTQFAAEVGNVTPGHLEGFYNGWLTISENQKLKIPKLPTELCRVARTSQQASASTTSEKFGTDGLIEMVPANTFSGTNTNEVTLSIPQFSLQQVQYATAATRIYVVFQAVGYLITGSSAVGSLQGQ